MAEKIQYPKIKLEGAKDWEPSEPGKSSGLLSYDGVALVEYTSLQPHHTKRDDGSVNFSICLAGKVVDDQEKHPAINNGEPGINNGVLVAKYFGYLGVMGGTGKNAGKPKITQFYEFLHAAGWPKDAIAKLDGKEDELPEFLAKIWKKLVKDGAESIRVPTRFRAEEAEGDNAGKWSSATLGYVTPKDGRTSLEIFRDMRATNGHREPLPLKAAKQWRKKMGLEHDDGSDAGSSEKKSGLRTESSNGATKQAPAEQSSGGASDAFDF